MATADPHFGLAWPSLFFENTCCSFGNNTMASDDNKRRRTASPNDDGGVLSIYHLLPYHLTAIADYLPQTSRALFAVASRPNDNEASKAVIASTANEGWETLDFADVGDLAARLNDSDLHALLLVIDAKNKMKRISLTGCNNIVGHGLEPLRESVVLEHICIPLPLGRMSTAVVTPIIDSIIETEGNTLREIDISNIVNAQLELPLRTFLAKFNNLLYFGNKECFGCDQPASMVCFECFKGSCEDCNIDDGSILCCSCCDLTFCENGHGGIECCKCFAAFNCNRCARNVESTAMVCRRCEVCLECTIRGGAADSDYDCCCGLHLPALVEKYEEVTEKNQELTEENKQLTEEIKQLRMEIEELQKNMSSALGLS